MRPSWDEQFAEDDDERRERWRKTKAKRVAEGKCWQCARLVSECKCPNVKHTSAPFVDVSEITEYGMIQKLSRAMRVY